MVALLGILFVVLGFVFALGAIEQNDFCGVRLRWTLGDEEVWRRSNCLAGEYLMIWGSLLFCCGEFSRRTLIFLLLCPAMVFVVLMILFSAFLFAYRNGSYSVDSESREFTDESSEASSEASSSSLVLDALLLALPCFALYLTREYYLQIHQSIPVVWSLDGSAAKFGHKSELFKLHYFALFLWLFLAGVSRIQGTVNSRARVWIFILRFAALAFVEALVLASLLFSFQVISNAWIVLLAPVLLILISTLGLCREGMASRF